MRNIQIQKMYEDCLKVMKEEGLALVKDDVDASDAEYVWSPEKKADEGRRFLEDIRQLQKRFPPVKPNENE